MVLSFELGLLGPKFWEHAGPVFGMPFSLVSTAAVVLVTTEIAEAVH